MQVEFLAGGGADLGGEVGEVGGGLEFDFTVRRVHDFGFDCVYVCVCVCLEKKALCFLGNVCGCLLEKKIADLLFS